jgi:hypothetical protein
MDGTVELARGDRIERIHAGEQPAAVEHLPLRPGHPPPGAQPLEQQRRQHGIAILAPLALLDAQRHPLAVDVGDLQRYHLARPQAGAMGHRQRRLRLQVARRRDQTCRFLPAQHHRQRPRYPHRLHLRHQLASIERDLEKEASLEFRVGNLASC